MQDASKDSGKIPHLAQARVGTVLKQKWHLDKLLGVGGMAVVYAATHRNGQRVAIKILHPDLSWSTEAKTRFLREGYLANAVDHDGVVSIIDDDVTEDGTAFLVMELLEGETVERRWKRQGPRLPVIETLSIADELLDVLAAAHAKGIVHRDIKPENVFLTRTGKVKILDFGIACLRERGLTASVTQSGTTLGTPAFMSPEQARGRWEEVDGRSDLWAVGAMMFALLTGRFVHEAVTPNEQLLAAMTAAAAPIASLASDLTPEVASVVDQALAHRQADRWPDAGAMQAAIRAAYASMLAERDGDVGSSAGRPATAAPSALFRDPDQTEAMPPLDFDSLATVTTRGGVANSPSAMVAAVAAHVPMRRRASSLQVGLSAGLLGVVLTLAALGRQTLSPPQSAMTTANTSAAAGSTPPVQPPVDHVHVLGQVPAPPATGVPDSLPVPVPERRVAPISSAHQPRTPTSVARADLAQSVKAPEPSAAPSASSEGLLDRRH